MKTKLSNILTFFFIIIFLNGCNALKSGLEGNKKSKNAEEFLINKKNPLVLPPDYSKFQEPQKKIEDSKEQTFDLKKVLNDGKTDKDNRNVGTNKSFKSKILERINEN